MLTTNDRNRRFAWWAGVAVLLLPLGVSAQEPLAVPTQQAAEASTAETETIVIGTAADGQPITIELDKKRTGDLIRGAVGLLRQKLIGESSERMGLVDDQRWTGADDPNRWVILVHGFASGIDATEPLLKRLDRPGIASRRFAYPNDGPIRDASDQLSKVLRNLARQYPDRKLTIIAHSMGCLVSRHVLESPERNPGNVDQLIMVAPPNHGSHLAQFPVGVDVEALAANVRQENVRWIVESALEGGMGSAQVDLRPESPLFVELNTRPRNPRVRYTIFAGTAGPLDAEEAHRMEKMGNDLKTDNGAVTAISGQLVAAGRSDEMIVGRGDGAVSLESAKLPGVEDFVPLPFNHSVLSNGLETPAGKRLIEEIVSRIVL